MIPLLRPWLYTNLGGFLPSPFPTATAHANSLEFTSVTTPDDKSVESGVLGAPLPPTNSAALDDAGLHISRVRCRRTYCAHEFRRLGPHLDRLGRA